MQKIKNGMLYLVLILVIACAPTSKISNEENKKWKPEFRILAGVNHGGVVENTNMGDIENIEVDAFSGATKLGANTGIHSLLPLKRNYIEIGLDYMFNNQTFKYNDVANNYFGKRDIISSQFMLPITYNIGCFRQRYSEDLFQIKLGYVFQYNLYNVSDDSPYLPEYSTNNFSKGLTVGLASIPFKFENGAKLGFFFDAYRGSQLYNDLYNRSTFKIQGSSYFKTGIIYHFKNK
jgi:hypothetical protein